MKSQNAVLKQLSNKTFTIDVTLTVDQITADRNRVLKSVQANFESKGFRKGKAPMDVVVANTSEEAIIEEVLTHLLNHVFQETVEANKLRPVVDPQIKIKTTPLTFDKPWEVQIISAELPTVTIDEKYLTEIKKINSSDSKEEERFNQYLDVLTKFAKTEIPEILIDTDTQKHLTRLVDEIVKSGSTVDAYFESIKTTREKYIENTKEKVKNEWILNLAVSQIAIDNQLKIEEQEVADITAKQPSLANNLNLVYYLLTQQKVFDFLKSQK